jgi:hypothetical protein
MITLLLVTAALLVDANACFVFDSSRGDANSFYDRADDCTKEGLNSLFVDVSPPTRTTLAALRMSNEKCSDIDTSNTADDGFDDTIRVRIWRALAGGEELTLRQLASIVGERKDLKSHLVHVEKQAKTLTNKSRKWRERRGLEDLDSRKLNKLRVVKRCDRKEMYVKLS